MPHALLPFYKSRGWKAFRFQTETWEAYADGKSGLVHAPTGLGKTLAVWGGPVHEAAEAGLGKDAPCTVLWITPLRALAADTMRSLEEPLHELKLPYTVAARTGDTSSYRKAQLRKRLPFCLVTTPESLSLMLTHEDFREKLAGLKTIIVDEWHELLGSKRGVQTQLCLARLRAWLPDLRTWGLSATLGNLPEARDVLLGDQSASGQLISGDLRKKIEIKTIMPRTVDRFPWAGHIGISLLKPVIAQIERAGSTLIFTNTRSQTEIWHSELSRACPDWGEQLAVHHGSIDREERERVEQSLREGTLKCVVCTSSLDLGVDFSPVEQVIQIGSPKGIARLLQRAGRAGHQPGQTSRLYCVPGNALDMVEFAAARDNIFGGIGADAGSAPIIEARTPPRMSLDVLVQHLVTVAIGEPCPLDALRAEIQSTHAYSQLTDDDWTWAIGFVTTGGKVLSKYPNYRKASIVDGALTVQDKRISQLHRMSIGTITSEAVIAVRMGNKTLGTVEEGFISRIKPGSQFIFSGRRLQLVRFRNQIAHVKNATGKAKGQIAMWAGSKMPLSNELAHAVAKRLHSSPDGSAEMERVAPVLKIQSEWSRLPSDESLLLERCHSREGHHVFIFPLAGRLVHEGMGALVASRITAELGSTVSASMNDYGFGLTSPDPLPFDELDWRRYLSTENLLTDLLKCLNAAELAKRQFREIARVAGLVIQNYPGQRKNTRDLQASSGLIYDVFHRYDPDNLLLAQAEKEILERQLELTRLRSAMEDIARRPFHLIEPLRLTPMAFGLWADRLNATVTGDSYAKRLASMIAELEQAAGA